MLPVCGCAADDGEQWLLLKAMRNIKEGEVLTDRYMASTLHRGDASLFHYGFLQARLLRVVCHGYDRGLGTSDKMGLCAAA